MQCMQCMYVMQSMININIHCMDNVYCRIILLHSIVLLLVKATHMTVSIVLMCYISLHAPFLRSFRQSPYLFAPYRISPILISIGSIYIPCCKLVPVSELEIPLLFNNNTPLTVTLLVLQYVLVSYVCFVVKITY